MPTKTLRGSMTVRQDRAFTFLPHAPSPLSPYGIRPLLFPHLRASVGLLPGHPAESGEVRCVGGLDLSKSTAAILTLLLQTGLRKGEFLGLRWKDIDLKTGVLTIPRSKNGEARHVPLTSTVRGILSRLPRSLDGSALVFPNGEGNRDLRWAEKTFPAAVAAAEIEDFRLHDTRHTFASRLAMEGVDLLAIKELGGWKSLAMVQRYAHLSPSHRNAAIERLVTREKVPQDSGAIGTQ